jgi:hypothetical protein
MNINQRISASAAAAPNRWLIAAAGALVMMTIGTVYSWAIFTQPLLVAFRWDLTVTTWGLNYGLILSAWGTAGLIGPILIARAKDLTGSFSEMSMRPLGGSVPSR